MLFFVVSALFCRGIFGAQDPRRLGHALTGDRKGLWRTLVGDYRIVAAIEDDRFSSRLFIHSSRLRNPGLDFRAIHKAT